MSGTRCSLFTMRFRRCRDPPPAPAGPGAPACCGSVAVVHVHVHVRAHPAPVRASSQGRAAITAATIRHRFRHAPRACAARLGAQTFISSTLTVPAGPRSGRRRRMEVARLERMLVTIELPCVRPGVSRGPSAPPPGLRPAGLITSPRCHRSSGATLIIQAGTTVFFEPKPGPQLSPPAAHCWPNGTDLARIRSPAPLPPRRLARHHRHSVGSPNTNASPMPTWNLPDRPAATSKSPAAASTRPHDLDRHHTQIVNYDNLLPSHQLVIPRSSTSSPPFPDDWPAAACPRAGQHFRHHHRPHDIFDFTGGNRPGPSSRFSITSSLALAPALSMPMTSDRGPRGHRERRG